MDEKEKPDLDNIQLPEFDYPEYPDWKRGLKWGLCVGIPAGLPGFVLFIFKEPSLLAKIFYVLMIFITSFLVVGSLGAVRPDSDKK